MPKRHSCIDRLEALSPILISLDLKAPDESADGNRGNEAA